MSGAAGGLGKEAFQATPPGRGQLILAEDARPRAGGMQRSVLENRSESIVVFKGKSDSTGVSVSTVHSKKFPVHFQKYKFLCLYESGGVKKKLTQLCSSQPPWRWGWTAPPAFLTSVRGAHMCFTLPREQSLPRPFLG